MEISEILDNCIDELTTKPRHWCRDCGEELQLVERRNELKWYCACGYSELPSDSDEIWIARRDANRRKRGQGVASH